MKLVDDDGSAILPEFAPESYKSLMDVYDPSDDTYLLLDTLWNEKECIFTVCPKLCCEIGPGSGVVSTYVQAMLKSSAMMLSIDINSIACEVTASTAKHNKAYNVEVIQDSLGQSVQTRLKNSIDLVIFNPPYVPTPDEEVGTRDIVASWAGGDRGRMIIDRFIPLLSVLLSNHGCAYMIAVAENDIQDIGCLARSHGLVTIVVNKRRAHNEALHVLKFRFAHEERFHIHDCSNCSFHSTSNSSAFPIHLPNSITLSSNVTHNTSNQTDETESCTKQANNPFLDKSMESQAENQGDTPIDKQSTSHLDKPIDSDLDNQSNTPIDKQVENQADETMENQIDKRIDTWCHSDFESAFEKITSV